MEGIDCIKIRKLIDSSVDEELKLISNNKLSKKLGITHPVLSRLCFDDTYNPGILIMIKISKYFNVSIDDLLIKD